MSRICSVFLLFILLLGVISSPVIAQPSVELINLNEVGNEYEYGDTVYIEWVSNDIGLPVTLDYSTDAGITWRKIITVKNRHSYNWVAPPIPSQHYRLRASITDTSFYWNAVDTLSANDFWTIEAYFINDSTLITLDGPNGKGDSLRIWDMNTGNMVMAASVLDDNVLQSKSGVSTITISTYADYIVSGSSDLNRSYLRTTKAPAIIGFLPGTIPAMTSQRIFDNKFRRNRSSLLTLSPSPFTDFEWMIAEYSYSPVESIWSIVPGTNNRSVDFALFLPSGKILAGYKKASYAKSKCSLLDEYTGELLAESFQEVKGLDVWLSDDGEKIAIPAAGGETYIFNANDLSAIRQIHSHANSILRSAFSPDGNYVLVLAGDTYTAGLYDVSISRLVQMPTLPSLVREVAFSPDSRLAILGCQNGDIASYDIVTGDLIWHKQGAHQGAIQDIVFSPNREYAVTASSGGDVYVWRTSMSTDYTLTDMTIHAPEIRTVPVIFEDVSIGESEQTTTIALYNESSFDLEVQSHILHGPASAEFELVDGGSPFIIKAHSNHQITVKFTPESSLPRKAWIEFAVQGSFIPTVVDLLGNRFTASMNLHEIFATQEFPIKASFYSARDIALFYAINRATVASLSVYDLLGHQLFSKEVEFLPGSFYHIPLDRPIAPGQYLLVIQNETGIVTLPILYQGA